MIRLGTALLWILACASVVLLIYELSTLIGSVLRPLLANPNVLQTDFHYYYDAAVRFSRNPPGLYSFSDDVIAGFAYPPPAIVPFLWLSRWPLGTALLALTILSYLMVAVAIQQWLKYLRERGHIVDFATTAAIVLIAVASGPVYMNAIFGQVNAFVLASAVAFIRLAPTAAVEAGVVLALGTWLKIYPAYLVLVGLWDRSSWRAIGYAAIASVAIALLLLPIIPPQAYRDYFQVLQIRGDKTAIHIANQSLVAFIERFRFPAEQFLFWTGKEAVALSAMVRVIGVVAAVGGALALRQRRAPRELKAAALIALIAVIAPLGWGHLYVMVLPLVILRLISLKQAPPIAAALVVISVFALMIPAGRHLPIDAAPDWIENILYSRYLIATFVLMVISSGSTIGHQTKSTIIASA
jgi:hypothetical protein